MTRLVVNLAVEGRTDRIVATRILEEEGFLLGNVYGERGKQHLDKGIVGFNMAAQYGRWLVLRDLDQDAPCAPELRSRLLPVAARSLVFRVVVRCIEAWLVADAEGFAGWLGIARALVPPEPDLLADPKSTLLKLAKRSRSRSLRDALLPREKSRAVVGPLYVSEVSEFVRMRWDPSRAAQRSPSLSGALRALRRLR